MLPFRSSEKMFSFLFSESLKTNLVTIYFLFTFASPSTLRHFPLLLNPWASIKQCFIFPVMIWFIHYKMMYDTNICFELLHLHLQTYIYVIIKSLCHCLFPKSFNLALLLLILSATLPHPQNSGFPLPKTSILTFTSDFRNQYDLCRTKLNYWRLPSTKKTFHCVKGTFNFLTL